jgi:hypothetical protein
LPNISVPLGLDALGAIIGGVVGGFICGYIVRVIIALLRNWLAPRIGGVKNELERRQNMAALRINKRVQNDEIPKSPFYTTLRHRRHTVGSCEDALISGEC